MGLDVIAKQRRVVTTPIGSPAPGPEPRVELRLLGPPRIALVDGPGTSLAPKDALLLAMLVQDGALPRDHLARVLWPDSPPASARANLRQRIKRLQAASSQSLLQPDGRLLALAPDVRHDLSGLDALLQLDAWAAQGRLLGQLDFDDAEAAAGWLAHARQTLHDRRSAAVRRIAQALEAQMQLAAALPYLKRLVADNPMDEAAVRWLMQLHFRNADGNAALRVYAELVERLRSQAQAEPDAQTRDLARLVQTAPVRTPAHAPAAAAWTALLRPPRLVEREVEWAQLQQAWLTGRVVLVTGEAGAGKTRLLSDFADRMAVTLRLRAHHGDSGVPYALLARWVQTQMQFNPIAPALPEWVRAELARLDAGLGNAAAGPLVPLRLSQALQWLAAPLPAVLLDDLHFADAASLELLPAVLSSVRCCLLASRTHELPAALQRWLDQAGHQVAQLNLVPWTEDGVHALLQSAALPIEDHRTWSALLWRHTGGQPLLLLETLRALLLESPGQRGLGAPPRSLPMPPQVLQLVHKRLDKLSTPALRVLQVAALAGDAFGPALAAAALAQPVAFVSAPWAELVAAALMPATGRVHDLILEATRQTLTAPLLLTLHQAIAQHLAGCNAEPARLALHWAAGGEPAQAAACHEAAAEASGRLSRRLEEAGQRGMAATCWAQAGQPERAFDAGAEAARAWVTAGDTARGLATTDALLAQAATPAQLTYARFVRCIGLVYAGRYAECLELATVTHQAAKNLGQNRWRAEIAVVAAQAAAAGGQRDRAAEFLADESQVPMDANDWKSNLTRLSVRANALSFLGQLPQALRTTIESTVLTDRPEGRVEQAIQQNNASMLLNQLGRTGEALAWAQKAWRSHVELGIEAGTSGAGTRMHVGLFSVGVGQFAGGIAELEEAQRSFAAQQDHGRVAITENHLIQAWTYLGQPAKALALLQPADRALTHSHRLRRASLMSELARLCKLTERHERPVDAGKPVEPAIAAHDDIVQARLLPPRERLERGAQLETRFATDARQACVLSARLLRLSALADLGSGQGAALARTLDQDLEDHTPAITYWPEAQFTVYRALLCAGEPAEAKRALRRAWGWVDHAHRHHVSEPFKASFLSRNGVNAAIHRAWLQRPR